MRSPEFMNVPYALAIDSGDTSADGPRPKELMLVVKAASSATTPASSIVCLTSSRPTSIASGT